MKVPDGQELPTTQSFVVRSANKWPLVEYLGHTSTQRSVVGSYKLGQLETHDLVESSFLKLPAHDN